MPAGQVVLERIVTLIIDPALLLIFTAGFFLFMWGLVVFLWNLREGKDYKAGIQQMVWGLAGMLIMMSVKEIIYLISNTFGLDLGIPDLSRINNIQTPTNFFK